MTLKGGKSEQLNKDNFSILHLNIRSLNANADNFREFLAFLNGNFSVIVITESWCDETANENSLLNLIILFTKEETIKAASFAFIYTNSENLSYGMILIFSITK